MPARLAYGLFYSKVIANLDEDGRLKVDALLGDAVARVELDKRRRHAAMSAEFEMG